MDPEFGKPCWRVRELLYGLHMRGCLQGLGEAALRRVEHDLHRFVAAVRKEARQAATTRAIKTARRRIRKEIERFVTGSMN